MLLSVGSRGEKFRRSDSHTGTHVSRATRPSDEEVAAAAIDVNFQLLTFPDNESSLPKLDKQLREA